MDTKLKRFLISLCLTVLLAAGASQNALADTNFPAGGSQPASLCLPGVYLNGNPECAVLGPAAVMTETANIEALIATQPERFPHIPESYGETEFGYFRALDSNSVIFPTFENAVANTSASDSLYKGYTFAAYTNMVEQDGRKYYQLSDGRWMRSTAINYHTQPNRFLGVQPVEQPVRKFGWVLKDTPTLKSPGYYEPLSGNVIPRYTLIEVFEERKVGLSDWYMVAPEEWIYMTQVALVYPAVEPPTGVEDSRWVEINIHEQTLAVYEDNQLVFATLVTTGSSRNYTRPGLFKIYEKHESTHMAANIGQDGAYFLMDVPWSMYFDERRALHAEYWHDHLGYKSSHGCVNLSFPDAEWLFQWADYDTWVYAWDPSGRTPENPKLFTNLLDEE